MLFDLKVLVCFISVGIFSFLKSKGYRFSFLSFFPLVTLLESFYFACLFKESDLGSIYYVYPFYFYLITFLCHNEYLIGGCLFFCNFLS